MWPHHDGASEITSRAGSACRVTEVHHASTCRATLASPDMSPPQYPHETIEAQIRLLADTAFAIGDLEPHKTPLGA